MTNTDADVSRTTLESVEVVCKQAERERSTILHKFELISQPSGRRALGDFCLFCTRLSFPPFASRPTYIQGDTQQLAMNDNCGPTRQAAPSLLCTGAEATAAGAPLDPYSPDN